MQRQIAKIIRRLNFQVTPIDVQQPAKRSHSKHRETDCDGPKPNTAIAHQRRWNTDPCRLFCFRAFSLLLFLCETICGTIAPRGVTSSKKSSNRKGGTAHEGESCARR